MNAYHVSALGLLFIACGAFAADEDSKAIRLVCTYSYSIDGKGERGDTSGQELFTVVPLESGRAVIRKQGLGVPFIGTISDEAIAGEASYEISNIKFEESLVINRFTGEFQLSFGAVGKGGLTHFGTCRAVTKQLF